MIYIVYIPTFYSSDFIVFCGDHGFQSGQYKSADGSIESFANNWIEREVSVGSKCPSFKFLFLRTRVKLCKFKHVYTFVHFAGTCVFSSSQILLWILFIREDPLSLIYGQTFIRKNMDVWVGWIIFKQGNAFVFLPQKSWFLSQIFEVP